MHEALVATLESRLGPGRVRVGAPLAPCTTFRVGGPADVLVEPRSSAEFVVALATAREAGVPVTLLGGGSNVLIEDAGIRGVVVRPRGGAISLDATGQVTADAAVSINGLVRWCILHARAGLEAWAGTPGSVGGAVYGNAHFAGELISQHIARATLVGADGTAREVEAPDMGFGYDRSRLQASGEVLLSATFRTRPGDSQTMRLAARQSLTFRKRSQPLHLPSAGCIFQNPDPARVTLPPGVPCSAGALIDRAGLKGTTLGDAQVSPVHANFIVNRGTASARDILQLIERCRAAVQARFGVTLVDEIVVLGEREAHVHPAD